ncbi:hypothetical protein ACR6C2_24225 [Streptomyces sp. INA 01156]
MRPLALGDQDGTDVLVPRHPGHSRHRGLSSTVAGALVMTSLASLTCCAVEPPFRVAWAVRSPPLTPEYPWATGSHVITRGMWATVGTGDRARVRTDELARTYFLTCEGACP